MKETFRQGLLRILAFLAFNIFIYSMAVVLRSIFFKDDGGIALIALYVAVMSAGFLLMQLLQDESRKFYSRITQISVVKFFTFTFNIKEKTRFIASVMIYISLLLPVLTAILVFSGKGFLRVFFETMVILVPWFLSIRSRNCSFPRIMSSGRSTAGFVVLLAAVVLAILNKSSAHLKPYLFFAAYAYILLFLLLRNQEDIDENIFDSKHIEKSILPRNLRSFNIKAVIAMFLGIMLLFNLKKLAMWIIYLAGQAAAYFVQFLLWLAAILLPKISGNPGTAQNPGPDFLGSGGTVVHPWMNFISNIVKYFILIYSAYLLLSLLVRKLPEAARKILGFLRRLISWDRDEKALQAGDYDDVTEIVRPHTVRGRRHAVKTVLKRTGRDLGLISDPVERIRFIYASILGMLAAYGIKTELSDTTLDILNKARVIKGMETPLNEVTLIYNDVRYGNRIPGPDILTKAEGRYREVAGLMRQ